MKVEHHLHFYLWGYTMGADLSKFWVVAVISNPVRFDSRVKLFERFKKYMERYNVNLCVVELAYGDRPYSIAQSQYEEPRCIVSGNEKTRVIQLRTWDEIWHKENMINVGISRLPSDWEYVAWIDADVEFKDDNWLEETWHRLQHHHVVQMFNQAIDFGPDDEIIQIHDGFMAMYWKNGMKPPQGSGYSGYYGYGGGKKTWHPGYGWAIRKEALEHLGGLMEFPILGAADHHMALCMIGEGERSLPKGIHSVYREKIMMWQDRALRYLKKDVGFVNTTLFHHWHGKKKDRRYVERWDVLTKNAFNPSTDLKKDSQGILQLVVESPRQIRLRDQIRLYFRNRNEDSIDLE